MWRLGEICQIKWELEEEFKKRKNQEEHIKMSY